MDKLLTAGDIYRSRRTTLDALLSRRGAARMHVRRAPKRGMLYTPVLAMLTVARGRANAARANAPVPVSCRTAFDCSFNGVCSAAGACVCRPAWKGTFCHELHLARQTRIMFLRVLKHRSCVCKTALALPRPTAVPTAALALPLQRHHR